MPYTHITEFVNVNYPTYEIRLVLIKSSPFYFSESVLDGSCMCVCCNYRFTTPSQTRKMKFIHRNVLGLFTNDVQILEEA